MTVKIKFRTGESMTMHNIKKVEYEKPDKIIIKSKGKKVTTCFHPIHIQEIILSMKVDNE